MDLNSRLMDKLAVAPEHRKLLTIIYFAFFNSGMMTILLGSMLPYMRESYSLNFVQSGLLLSSHQIGNLCAMFLSGVLPYALGRKKTTIIFGSCLILGLVTITLTGNFILLFIAFVATGISRGTMGSICNASVAEFAGNRTGGLNILHSMFAVGALLGPMLLLASVHLPGLGWRTTPRFLSLLGLIAFVFIGFSTLSNRPTPRAPKNSIPFFRNRMFWINVGILFFYLSAESIITGWFVTYFTETGRLSSSFSTMTPTLVWLMVLVGRLICAGLSSRVDKDRLILLLGILFIGFFALMLFSTSTTLCILGILGVGISMAGIYPTTVGTTPNASSTAVTGTLTSIACFGGIIMPSIVGALAETRGMAAGVGTVLFALAGMVILMIVKVASQRSESKIRP